MQLKKYSLRFLKVILVVLLVVVAFFFWASSSNFSEDQYQQLISYKELKPVEKDSIYTIATYNIGYLSGMTNNTSEERNKLLFDINLKTVQTVFDTLNIDIVALQEIDYVAERSFNIDQEAALANRGFPYAARVVNWDKRYMPFPYWPISSQFGKVVSGQSIISKYPLKDHERIVLERVKDNGPIRDAFYLERLAQVVTVTLDGVEVKLINVHLEAFDRDTRERQTKHVAELYRELSEKYPTILLGDFNSSTYYPEPVIYQLTSLPNTAFAVNDIESGTYPSIDPELRIDYIFYDTRKIEKVSAKVVQEVWDSSDHLPVMMRFKLKK